MKGPELWKRAEELYHAALEQKEEERQAFLLSACGGDDELRQEVESLLGYEGQAAGFLEEPAFEMAGGRPAPQDRDASVTRLAPGVRVGSYEILSLVDAGGMGEVYRARDGRLDREVAVKVLPREVPGLERVKRFEREARAAGALNHPNVLTVHDVGTHEGAPYLVTELLEGATLRERVSRGRLDLRQAVDVAIQLASGLAAAHEKGIVHRDLKPENVFLTRDGRAKILDFGLAHVIETPALEMEGERTRSQRLTESGVLLGTIAYMSPEQVRLQPVDARSDVFALGSVLYEMLSGRRAFQGATPADTLAAILHADPPSLAAEAPGIPPSIDRVVRRCLAKEPAQRFQSARDVGFALEALGETPPPRTRVRTPAARRWAVGLGAALAAGGLFGLGALTSWRWGRGTQDRPRAVSFRLLLPEGVTLPHWPTTSSMALSPDGRQLAFIGLTRGQPKLWLRDLGRADATVLEGTEGASSPFWSPDGNTIAFFARGELKKVPAKGGPAEALCAAGFGNAGTWGADGTVLFTEWAGGREGLYRVSSLGGTPARVELRTAAGPEAGIGWPTFLPDGHRFLYLRGVFGVFGGRTPANMMALASLGSPDALHLGASDSKPVVLAGNRIVYVREGTLLVQNVDPDSARLRGDAASVVDRVWFLKATGAGEFTASADGQVLAFRGPPSVTRLAWLDHEGREVGTVGAPGPLDAPRLSPDGGRVAFEVADARTGGRDIWTHDLVRGVRSRVTLDPSDATSVVWSPDGQRLAYSSASQEEGPLQVRIKRADGAGADTGLVRTNGVQLAQDWSPDGRWILFQDQSPGRRPVTDLWLVPVDGSRPPERLESMPVSHSEGRFSPDGHWVAFVSDETGKTEVVVARFPGLDHRQQVSTDGGMAPRWRKDGRELFYFTPAGQLMSVAVGEGPARALSPARPLFTLRAPPGCWGSGGLTGQYKYDVDASGSRFLVSLGSEPAPPIVITVGWHAAGED